MMAYEVPEFDYDDFEAEQERAARHRRKIAHEYELADQMEDEYEREDD